jgi:hypothetical protein
MSADAAQIAAEKLHAKNVGKPGTLLIDGLRCKARIFTERGTNYTELGGKIQHCKISAVILCSLLPKARVLTATGETRPQLITHLETSTQYRIDTGGVDLSPHGVYWTLEAAQPTAQ